MAPVLDKSSPLVTAEVTIAGVKVVALIDTGATSSCCRWGWYNQWKSHLGPLKQTNTLVIGVGNVPVELKDKTDSLKLEWDSVIDHCEMMVLTTLEDVDVILGMDIINRLNVHATSLPWPYRQMYSCIRQKGGRTSSKSPRRKGSEDPRMFKRTITPQYKTR